MSELNRRNLAHGFYTAFPSHAKYWDRLESLFSPVRVEKGEVLLNQNDLWNSAYYIESGIARLFYSDRNGNEFNKDFFYEGNFFWPVAPSAHKEPSLFAISALSSMLVWKAPYMQFRKELESLSVWHPIALQLAEMLAERKIMREASFLLDTPTERYIKLFEEYSELVNRIPDYHMASFLGITPVSFSRIKKKFLGEGFDANAC